MVAQALLEAGPVVAAGPDDLREGAEPGKVRYSACAAVGTYSVHNWTWEPRTRAASSGLQSAGAGSLPWTVRRSTTSPAWPGGSAGLVDWG